MVQIDTRIVWVCPLGLVGSAGTARGREGSLLGPIGGFRGGLLMPPGASWGLLGLLGSPGAAWGFLGPPRASWFLVPVTIRFRGVVTNGGAVYLVPGGCYHSLPRCGNEWWCTIRYRGVVTNGGVFFSVCGSVSCWRAV